jgi:phosphomannomutase
MIRPSGTEPVLKIYAEAVWPVRSRDGLTDARAGAERHVLTMLAAAASALEPAAEKVQS